MTNAKNFPEDFEREYLKDYVYLQEAMIIEEQQYTEWLAEQNKKPAKIEVIKEIPKEHEVQHNILPF
jgi:hypothetical protein